MYGLIVLLDSVDLGLDDSTVIGFQSKEQAVEFAFERLAEYGCVQAGRLDHEQAIDEFNESLGAIEMFHIWPLVSGEGLMP